MPTRHYPLERNGPKRLSFDWTLAYKDFTVRLDGQPLDEPAGQLALLKGKRYRLPDGSALDVRLVRRWYGNELEVLHAGLPVPGTPSDPALTLRTAVLEAYLIGGLNFIWGLLAAFMGGDFSPLAFALVAYKIGFGLLFIGLGYLAHQRDRNALIAALALFLVDGVINLFTAPLAGGSLSFGAFLMRLVLAVPLYLGIRAIDNLQKETSAALAAPSDPLSR